MDEAKVEKKKRGVVKRILKWIGLAVVTILLIATLILQAPWKVTILLGIVLAACTILPRPFRKWFWLSAGAVVIALIIWVSLPDENGDWRPYTFDEELAVIEAKRAIPDEENAATIYNQLLEDFDSNSFYPDFWDSNVHDCLMFEFWSSQDYPELAQWMQRQQSTITMLMQAAQKEDCRFPIAYDTSSLPQSTERLLPMRHWAILLIWSANNNIAESNYNEAFKKYIAVLQMAEHLYQQPATLDMLVGITIEALVLELLNKFIVSDNATEEYLIIIEEALTKIKHNWLCNFPDILECEKLMMKSLLGIFYEINTKGKIRFSRDPTAEMRKEFLGEIAPPTYWQRKLTKAGTILGWFFLPATPEKAAKIIDESFQKCYAMAEPDFDWTKKPKEVPISSIFSISLRFNFSYFFKLMADWSAGSCYGIHDAHIRAIAKQRGGQIIIALRRYKNKNGDWPGSLDDIKTFADAEVFVDPINGDSFVYKLTEDSFTFYSKGKNNIDENGQYNSTFDPNTY